MTGDQKMADILKFKRKKPVSWDQMLAMIENGPYRSTKLLSLLSILKDKEKKRNNHAKLGEWFLIRRKIREIEGKLELKRK